MARQTIFSVHREDQSKMAGMVGYSTDSWKRVEFVLWEGLNGD